MMHQSTKRQREEFIAGGGMVSYQQQEVFISPWSRTMENVGLRTIVQAAKICWCTQRALSGATIQDQQRRAEAGARGQGPASGQGK